MIYHKTDIRKMIDTIIDADIKLHRYMEYLERQASTAENIPVKDCYMRDVKRIREIANELVKMYEDFASLYYDMDDETRCMFEIDYV